MEATAVSLARSVLDGVMSSAGTAFADEVALLLGVPQEVEFIRNELEMMQAFLKLASAHPEAAGRSDTVRAWVKQVRDLAYDVEDCLLDFALYAARTSSSSRAGSWKPSAIAERHRIAARIRYLKACVEALNQRNQRYHIAVCPAAAGVQEAQLPAQHDDQLAFQAASAGIIGRGNEKDEVISRLLSGTNGAPRPRVVSVWGMGGMGKSSLLRMVYNDPDLLAVFDCSAWITVPHPLDTPDVFRRRLNEELTPGQEKTIEEHLREKRYLVIVDDVLSQEEWENIWQVFQFRNDKDSRVIVTTRREDVARHCAAAGHVPDGQELIYELKPLNDVEAKSLLCQKVRSPHSFDFS